MEEERAKRAQRLHRVMSQLHLIEEQRKIELQRREAELQRSQEEVINALNTDDALHGLFTDTTARFLRNLAQEAQNVAEERELQSRKLLERATKMKTVERLRESLQASVGRIRQANELREIIERYVGKESASLPQD
jgi:NhaP-type Na+/H+ and K+/H+ antiporter